MHTPKTLTYESHTYEVILPRSSDVKSITVNKLKTLLVNDKKTPVVQMIMPKESGFFHGVEYQEQNTLLGYNNNSWKKVRTIQFGKGGQSIFGTKEISTVSHLNHEDKSIKDAALGIA